MSTLNLIVKERAKFSIKQSTFTTAEDQTIDTLITACSAAFVKYWGREIQVKQYDELHRPPRGDKGEYLFLRAFPVINVDRVAYALTDIVEVTNTSWPTNTRATVQVLSDRLRLTRVASATTTKNDLLWTSYTTLATLATAITAVGNGWSASVLDTNYNTWASEDLRPIQGSLSAANSAKVALKAHLEEMDDYDLLVEEGALVLSDGAFRGDEIRVVYTAGYEDVPEDIQQACAIMVAGSFIETKRDPMSPQTKTADFSYNASGSFQMPWPANVLRLIAPYRLRM